MHLQIPESSDVVSEDPEISAFTMCSVFSGGICKSRRWRGLRTHVKGAVGDVLGMRREAMSRQWGVWRCYGKEATVENMVMRVRCYGNGAAGDADGDKADAHVTAMGAAGDGRIVSDSVSRHLNSQYSSEELPSLLALPTLLTSTNGSIVSDTVSQQLNIQWSFTELQSLLALSAFLSSPDGSIVSDSVPRHLNSQYSSEELQSLLALPVLLTGTDGSIVSDGFSRQLNI